MKQLTLAAAALLAAMLLSGNASAIAGSPAGKFYAASQAVKVTQGCCHRRGCAPCGSYRYTVYPSCGRYDLYNYTHFTGCGYGHSNYRCGCGCAYGYSGCGYRAGWGWSGWFY